MKYLYAAPLLFTIAAGHAPSQVGPARDSGALSVAIVADKGSSGVATVDHAGKFQVLFTNRSKQPIRLWREFCEPGYQTLSFRAEQSDGSLSIMKKHVQSRAWKYTPVKTITIPPGESFLRDIRPSSGLGGDPMWAGSPDPNTGQPIQLTAVFAIEPTAAAKEYGVWTGRVTSEPLKARYVDARLHTPNDYMRAGFPKRALSILQADPIWISKLDDMQQTPLHMAAWLGYVEVAKWLLDHGADVNARAYNQFTPLHLTHSPQIVKLLLEHQASVDAKDVGGSTLEKAASRYAQIENYPPLASEAEQLLAIIKMLRAAGAEYDIRSACCLNDIERVRTLVKDKNQAKDRLAMRWATEFGRTQITKLLLESGADPHFSGYGDLPVSYFAIEHPDILAQLLEAGAEAKVRVSTGRSRGGEEASTLLRMAAEKGNFESAKLLVARGVDMNQVSSAGWTALHQACFNGHPAFVEWLLKNKANASVRTEAGWTPMALAVLAFLPGRQEDNTSFQDVIRRLADAGVEMDVFAAIACDDLPRVTQLLQADPKVGESKNVSGRPALHFAVDLDRQDIVKLLLDRGTDPDVRSTSENHGHETPLLEAAFWGRLEIAEMLIKHGAKVNAKTAHGWVPLHEAARLGQEEVTRLLLANGADVNAKDENGQTPLDWARNSEDEMSPRIVKLLQDQAEKK